MATYNKFDYTTFKAVNLRGSGGIRFVGDGGAGTLIIKASNEGDRQYYLPDKSGTFPIMGTFSVQLPALTTAYYSTVATVTGIRSEDALVVMPNKQNSAAYGFDNGTGVILIAATPGAGQITLYFANLGNGTGYVDRWYSYLACR